MKAVDNLIKSRLFVPLKKKKAADSLSEVQHGPKQ
jgi:hypothetical protein